jgi:hypothetical protein
MVLEADVIAMNALEFFSQILLRKVINASISKGGRFQFSTEKA